MLVTDTKSLFQEAEREHQAELNKQAKIKEIRSSRSFFTAELLKGSNTLMLVVILQK